MTETFVVVVAAIAVLMILARRAAMPGPQFPEPLDQTATLPQQDESDADTDDMPGERRE